MKKPVRLISAKTMMGLLHLSMSSLEDTQSLDQVITRLNILVSVLVTIQQRSRRLK